MKKTLFALVIGSALSFSAVAEEAIVDAEETTRTLPVEAVVAAEEIVRSVEADAEEIVRSVVAAEEADAAQGA